jgi:metal-responsive CopG/Arc/MetJ family transcriptional regulator
MPKTIAKEPFVRQSISFPKGLLAEIRRIVVEDERHGNLSRFVQDLARAEVTRREEAKADKGEAA